MRASMHGEVADTRSKEMRQCGPQDPQPTLCTNQPGLCLLCPTILLIIYATPSPGALGAQQYPTPCAQYSVLHSMHGTAPHNTCAHWSVYMATWRYAKVENTSTLSKAGVYMILADS